MTQPTAEEVVTQLKTVLSRLSDAQKQGATLIELTEEESLFHLPYHVVRSLGCRIERLLRWDKYRYAGTRIHFTDAMRIPQHLLNL